MDSPVPGPTLSAEGAVSVEYIVCADPSCRCRQGSLHGPYFYQFTRTQGLLHRTHADAAHVGTFFVQALLSQVTRHRKRAAIQATHGMRRGTPRPARAPEHS